MTSENPATDNRPLLDSHLRAGHIRVEPSDVLFEDAPPLRAGFDRVEGMLLGVAVGDALGNPTESRLPSARESRWGEIAD